MKKSEKWKAIFKSKSLIAIVTAFVVAPALINIGMVLTDIIYEETGFTLTAKGLNNAEWLDFWKQYLAVAISFVGVCVAYVSSHMDRKQKIQEEQAQQYLEGVRREENVLVEVTQGFNTGMAYKALLQQANTTNIYDGRKVLADARTNIDYVHIKFEILTELCDDFRKCENCDYLPCVDRKVMLELRDLFYDMEKHYFDMLEAGEKFLERLNQEQERIQLMGTEKEIQNKTERIIELYERQGLCDEADASKQDLLSIKEQIQNLDKSKLESAEMNRFIAEIQKEIDYINKFARPKFIRYCKIYIDMKKAHARKLRETGHIQYNKVNQSNQTDQSEQRQDISISDLENKIMELLKVSPDATTKEIAKKLEITDNQVKYYIKKLKDDGKIERIGTNRKGSWRVK